jgi:capsular polysaccharide biosynthesis protein
MLKKLMIALCTKNPYKVRTFTEVFQQPTGAPVEIPENLSAVLSREEGEVSVYRPPLSLTGEKLRFREISGQPRFMDFGIFKNPDRFLYSISHAGIFGQTGLVYEPLSRCFIAESAKDWTRNLSDLPHTNAYRLPPPLQLTGLTFSFLTPGAEGGFYHFLFESLTKADLYKTLITQADQLLFNGPQTDWKLKWIRRAGIDPSKIIWVDNTSHFRCRQLLFTSRLVEDQQVSRWGIRALHQLFSVPESLTQKEPKNVIWLTRKGQTQRTIEWEERLREYLPAIVFADLASLSAEQTIALMRNTSFVAGPHGAAFSNIYLCSRGTKVLEIFPAGTPVQPCYSRLSDTCGLSHAVMYLDFKNEWSETQGLETLVNHLTNFLC